MTPSVEELLGVVCETLERHSRETSNTSLARDLRQCRMAVEAVAGMFDSAVANRLALLVRYDSILESASRSSARGPGEDPAASTLPALVGTDYRPSRLEEILIERRRRAVAVLDREADRDSPWIDELRALVHEDVTAQVLVAPSW